jgi:hypothetical protein
MPSFARPLFRLVIAIFVRHVVMVGGEVALALRGILWMVETGAHQQSM